MIHIAQIRNLIMAVCVASLFGCATTPPHMPPVARIKGVQGLFRIGQIVDLHRGEALPFTEFLEKIVPNDIIFVGEVHNNGEHHLIQFQILQSIIEECGPVDVAMEFFRAPQQPLLDRYLSGGMSESEFLEAVDWEKSWGYPFHLYRPLLKLAREKGCRVLAINVPQELVRRVARVGLSGLTPEERSSLPTEIDLTDKAHRAYVREAYLMHERHGIPNFQFFYEAQCVYEEVMAQNLADYFIKAGRNHRKVVAFTGNGHIVYRFGIPNRLQGRIPVSSITVMPYPLSVSADIPSEIADFVWLTPVTGLVHGALPARKESPRKVVSPEKDHARS